MRVWTYIVAFALMGTASSAQQVLTEIGRVTTSFDYTNSDGGHSLEFFSGTGNSYHFGYRATVHKRLYPTLGFVYNRYQSSAHDSIYNNRFEWDTEYLGLSLGAEIEILKTNTIAVLGRFAVSPQIMVKGAQTLDQETLTLRGVEQFDRPFFFATGGLGVNYCTDSKLAVSLRYQWGKGTAIGKSSDAEVLKLQTQTISICLLWNLSKCKYCPSRR